MGDIDTILNLMRKQIHIMRIEVSPLAKCRDHANAYWPSEMQISINRDML